MYARDRNYNLMLKNKLKCIMKMIKKLFNKNINSNQKIL